MSATILLVDDSATIRNIIKIYLMGLPLEFKEADRAERALQLLVGEPVDLIVADVNMPGMNGLEFIEHIRKLQDPRLKDIPIVLLTGEKSDELKAQGRAAGANDFISKPVTSANLRGSLGKFVKLD